LDELGRGTSTFDGYSIAYAVLDKIANSIKACTLFATHYHMLTQGKYFESCCLDSEFASHPGISLKRMKLGEIEDEFVPLYTMEDGSCLNSYGLAVAKFAGVPPEVVDKATLAARQFQR
jgi:DNA mismatch repair protein MSH6